MANIKNRSAKNMPAWEIEIILENARNKAKAAIALDDSRREAKRSAAAQQIADDESWGDDPWGDWHGRNE